MSGQLIGSDVADGLRFLRSLTTAEIASIGRLLLPGAMAGQAGPNTIELLHMMGFIMSERESR